METRERSSQIVGVIAESRGMTAKEKGEYGLIASDIVEAIPYAIKE